MSEKISSKNRERSLYNPEHQKEEALALKDRMLKTFIHSAGLVPQTFVFIKPQCARVIAEARAAGYSDELFTRMMPEEKRAFSEQLVSSRNNAHNSASIDDIKYSSPAFSVFDNLYLNSGVRGSISLTATMQKVGWDEQDIINFASWQAEEMSNSRDRLRQYKVETKARRLQMRELGAVTANPREVLQQIIDEMKVNFYETDLYKKTQGLNKAEDVSHFLEFIFPSKVFIG